MKVWATVMAGWITLGCAGCGGVPRVEIVQVPRAALGGGPVGAPFMHPGGPGPREGGPLGSPGLPPPPADPRPARQPARLRRGGGRGHPDRGGGDREVRRPGLCASRDRPKPP
ncbi:hypothetical protein WDZ92_35810, partial [Nostoc sp. NIES-2111]